MGFLSTRIYKGFKIAEVLDSYGYRFTILNTIFPDLFDSLENAQRAIDLYYSEIGE